MIEPGHIKWPFWTYLHLPRCSTRKCFTPILWTASYSHERFLGYCTNLQCNKYVGTWLGSATHVACATTVPPALASIVSQGDWSLDKILDIYWHYAEVGDSSLVGRCLCWMNPIDSTFSVLPPHWTGDNPASKGFRHWRGSAAYVWRHNWTTSIQYCSTGSSLGIGDICIKLVAGNVRITSRTSLWRNTTVSKRSDASLRQKPQPLTLTINLVMIYCFWTVSICIPMQRPHAAITKGGFLATLSSWDLASIWSRYRLGLIAYPASRLWSFPQRLLLGPYGNLWRRASFSVLTQIANLWPPLSCHRILRTHQG